MEMNRGIFVGVWILDLHIRRKRCSTSEKRTEKKEPMSRKQNGCPANDPSPTNTVVHPQPQLPYMVDTD